MKKFFIVVLEFFGMLVLIAFLAKMATADSSSEVASMIDAFNPLVPTSRVYVKTQKPKSVNEFGTASYEQTAICEDGKTRPIAFTGLQELKKEHYLALEVKGAYVKTYEEVTKEKLPKKVLAIIDNY